MKKYYFLTLILIIVSSATTYLLSNTNYFKLQAKPEEDVNIVSDLKNTESGNKFFEALDKAKNIDKANVYSIHNPEILAVDNEEGLIAFDVPEESKEKAVRKTMVYDYINDKLYPITENNLDEGTFAHTDPYKGKTFTHFLGKDKVIVSYYEYKYSDGESGDPGTKITTEIWVEDFYGKKLKKLFDNAEKEKITFGYVYDFLSFYMLTKEDLKRTGIVMHIEHPEKSDGARPQETYFLDSSNLKLYPENGPTEDTGFKFD